MVRPADLQHVVSRPAAERRLDARDQFHYAEGLGDIIVRAEVKPRHLIAFLSQCAEHDTTHAGITFLHRFQHFQAVAVGKHDIEQDDVGRLLPQPRRKIADAPERTAGQLFSFQRKFYQPRDACVVLEDIYDAFHFATSEKFFPIRAFKYCRCCARYSLNGLRYAPDWTPD